eukprot:1178162-Prorocentrum_minimum.AAC.3
MRRSRTLRTASHGYVPLIPRVTLLRPDPLLPSRNFRGSLLLPLDPLLPAPGNSGCSQSGGRAGPLFGRVHRAALRGGGAADPAGRLPPLGGDGGGDGRGRKRFERYGAGGGAVGAARVQRGDGEPRLPGGAERGVAIGGRGGRPDGDGGGGGHGRDGRGGDRGLDARREVRTAGAR